MRYLFFVLFLFIGFGENAFSQGLTFERLGIKQGLSQNTVRCVLQDSLGFLWIGTADGLNRYDGMRFKIYTKELDKPYSLVHGSITSITEGTEDRLWIGTRIGAVLFDKRKERFYALLDSTRNNKAYRAWQIVEDRKLNCLWIGSEGEGLIRLDLANRQTKKFQYYLPKSYKNIYAVVQDRHNPAVLWLLGEKNTILRFDKTTAKSTIYVPPYEVPYREPIAGLTYDLKQDKAGNLWVASYGLSIFNTQKLAFTKHWIHDPLRPAETLASNQISAITFEEEHNKVWIGTFGAGISVLDLKKQTFQHYSHNIADKASLSNNDIQSLFCDRSGIIWVGTYNGGLSKYDRKKNHFTHFKKTVDNANSLVANEMRGILEDHDGKLWIGTTNAGITIIDRKKNTFRHLSTETKDLRISMNRVNGIIEDRQKNIWVATLGEGLNKISFEKTPNGIKESIKYYKRKNFEDKVYIPNNVRTMAEDWRGNIWIGGSTGLTCLDPQTDSINYYGLSEGLSALDVKSLACDPDTNLIWVGTDGGGLNLLDLRKKTFEHFQFDPKNPRSISSDMVNCIFVDSRKKVWIGTMSGGLNLFDRESKTFRRFSTQEGLPNNVIYGILEDNSGFLWISTNRGLSQLNPQTFECRNFYEEDGLQSNEFNALAYHKSCRTGELFFGGINGFNAFFADSLRINDYKPNVVLTDLRIFNHSVKDYDNSILKEVIYYTSEIELSHKENVFSLHFAVLDFSSPEKVRYAYIMEGFDQKWTYSTAFERSATYTNLAPNDYIFRVKATNSDGVWSPNETRIKIRIAPPLWETWWFRVSAIFLVLFLVYRIYLFRIRAMQAKKAQLETLVTDRTAQLIRQQTEIIQKNTELETQKEALEKQKTEIENFYRDLRILSDIGQEITNILDLNALLQKIYIEINALMSAEGFGIGLYQKESKRIVFPNYIEEGITYPEFSHEISDPNRFSVWCFNNQKALLINDLLKDYSLYVPQAPEMSVGRHIVSVIYVPLFLNSEAIGVLTVQSFRKNAYSEQEMNILKNLGVYISIAIDNAQKYQELDHAKANLEQKNRYVLDSIRYAETIQEAILPTDELMSEIFGKDNYFVFYKPKDIVSGDFYWVKQLENGRIYFAVIDCTGHGVPGALMSMIGSAILTEMIHNEKIADPAMALKNLHLNIRAALRQEERQNNDGMDVALCLIENKQLTFSGAKLNLYHISDHILQEHKGDRKSLGGQHRGLNHVFTNETFELKPDDQVFLLSDGFLDQSNPQRKKYGSANWRKLLTEIERLESHEQKEKIIEILAQHQQTAEQRDDITIMGVRWRG